MEKKTISIKSELLKLFNEGKSEAEALEEISKMHSSCNVSKKTVSTWYGKFRSKNQDLGDSKVIGTKKKFSDEFLIDLVNNNPDFSMNKLAKLAGVSAGTMFSRIKELNGDGRLNYKFKDNFKFTDEFLIDLIDKNPKLSMEKLAQIAGVSEGTIFNRIKQLKSSNEKVNYCDKDNYKFTDEFLIDLVNNNPALNMKGLAKLAGTSQSAISSRIKQINNNGVRVNYVKKQYIPDGYNTSSPKLTYEFLDDLINSNPDLTMYELAELAGVSFTAINNKIKKFNKAGKTLNYCKKDAKKLTDEFLSELINKNPGFNLNELSQLTGVSIPAISRRIIQINTSGEGVNYTSKQNIKLTNERLIDLMNENPGLSITELAKLAEVSTRTISRRIKQINSSGQEVDYYFKDNIKLTNERLIDLMNENPGLSMAKLAKLAGVSATTISRRIKEINSNGIVVNYNTKAKPKQKPTTSEK